MNELKNKPTIKIADDDVWLVFPNVTISIEGICKFGMPGPIVRQNLRKWRDEILLAAHYKSKKMTMYQVILEVYLEVEAGSEEEIKRQFSTDLLEDAIREGMVTGAGLNGIHSLETSVPIYYEHNK